MRKKLAHIHEYNLNDEHYIPFTPLYIPFETLRMGERMDIWFREIKEIQERYDTPMSNQKL